MTTAPITTIPQPVTTAGITAFATNPFVFTAAPLTLPVAGGTVNSPIAATVAAPATATPAGVFVMPAAAVPTGTVTGGDVTPAVEQPPFVVEPDTAGGGDAGAAAAKGDEAPAIGTRLEGLLAALAAAAYGVWHWRHRSKAAPPRELDRVDWWIAGGSKV